MRNASLRRSLLWAAVLAVSLVPVRLFAADAAASPEMFRIDNLWMMVATALVFAMNLGFAALEAGLTRAKNTVNILFKNTVIAAIGIITYALVGFGLMYPGAKFAGALFGFGGFGIAGDVASGANGPGYTYWTNFLFQAMFAATAATIVSGAVAERVKLSSFLLFTAVYVSVCYPLVGMWGWGGGWLATMGFHDFAGSTFVHSVGGWGALVGALLLGPRLGKFTADGKSRAIAGHSMPLATIGVFVLWLGWFGFNGGSVLSADPVAVSLVLVTTNLAAAAGVISSMIVSWTIQRKPDLTMVLNGALAGLVGITAGADCVTPVEAMLIGAIAGVIVVLAVLLIDQKLRLDDPVGAISVHLICGVWGTLAAGLFGAGQHLGPQLLGIAATAAFCLFCALAVFGLLKLTVGLRVDSNEELRGLDIGEHGMEAYGGFQIFSNQ